MLCTPILTHSRVPATVETHSTLYNLVISRLQGRRVLQISAVSRLTIADDQAVHSCEDGSSVRYCRSGWAKYRSLVAGVAQG